MIRLYFIPNTIYSNQGVGIGRKTIKLIHINLSMTLFSLQNILVNQTKVYWIRYGMWLNKTKDKVGVLQNQFYLSLYKNK